MDKKPFIKRLNIIDVIAVVLIVLVALVALGKLVGNFLKDEPKVNTPAVSAPAQSTGKDSEEKSDQDPHVYVTYTVRAKKQPAALYETAKERIPGQLMMAGVLYDGWVVGVEKEPSYVLAANGSWVEDPAYVDLLFTVEAIAPRADVMTTLVGTQEVRIGDPGYDLNTEYLEFRDTTVVDVTWHDWDFTEEDEETNAEKLEKAGLSPLVYVVRAENQPAELYENALRYLPGQLMASGALHNGWVVDVQKEPVMVLAADGTWVEDPTRVHLEFTVEAYARRQDVQVTLVGTQEIRLGLPKYTLKTECLEFRNTVVTDIDWTDWTKQNDLESKLP